MFPVSFVSELSEAWTPFPQIHEFPKLVRNRLLNSQSAEGPQASHSWKGRSREQRPGDTHDHTAAAMAQTTLFPGVLTLRSLVPSVSLARAPHPQGSFFIFFKSLRDCSAGLPLAGSGRDKTGASALTHRASQPLAEPCHRATGQLARGPPAPTSLCLSVSKWLLSFFFVLLSYFILGV